VVDIGKFEVGMHKVYENCRLCNRPVECELTAWRPCETFQFCPRNVSYKKIILR